MWNSGGKASWETGGGRRGGFFDPLGIFSPTQSENSKKYGEMAMGNAQTQQGQLDAFTKRAGEVGETAWNSALAFTGKDSTTSDENLFKLMAQRLREQLLPGLSARGLTSSGPGINIEAQKTGELATEFAGTAFERDLKRQTLLQDAAKGWAVLNSLPIELRNAFIQALLGGEAAGKTASILEQYGGGSGISAMMGNSGTNA